MKKIFNRKILLLTIAALSLIIWNNRLKAGESEMIPETTITIYDAITKQEKNVNVISKSKEEWKSILDKKVYHVTREEGTEPAFSGELLKNNKMGIYRCSNCDNHLFLSSAKFDSQTGWPSFYQPVSSKNIRYVEDNRLFMKRTEVICALCGAHLGHVFDDGPMPTGKRYCMNSVALNFIETP